jgi:hypothetical protein
MIKRDLTEAKDSEAEMLARVFQFILSWLDPSENQTTLSTPPAIDETELKRKAQDESCRCMPGSFK